VPGRDETVAGEEPSPLPGRARLGVRA
jgi:hypothetical protein